MPTDHDSIDLGHEDEIMEAFVAYDRLVRWEEHNSRLDATEPIVERAYARGRIIAMVANLAAEALGATSDGNETTTPNTEPNPDSIVEAHVVREGKFASVWRFRWPGDEQWREHECPNPIVESLVAENARLREQKDGAYSERNQTVIALAHMARMAGCRVGVREHEGDDWDDDWRAILFIDLPTGQASWHFHDSERPLLASFPAYPDEWDEHTTDEKYDRLRALEGDD